MLKYLRNYRIEIEDLEGNIQTIGYPVDKNLLTVDFQIDRNYLGDVQTASFTIYNLPARIRYLINKNMNDFLSPNAQLNQPGVTRSFVFYGGYGDSNIPLVFSGSVNVCNSVREEGSPDWQTNISCFDPGLFPKYSQSFSFSKSLSRSQAIDQVASKIGVSVGIKGSLYTNGPGFTRGYGATASANSVLQKITGGNATGGNFYYENKTLNIVNDNEAIESVNGFTTLSNNVGGLLGVPYYEQTYIFANCLFEPRVQMAQLLNLQAPEALNIPGGQYKVIAYSHAGTMGGAVGGPCKTQIQLFGLLKSEGWNIIPTGSPI